LDDPVNASLDVVLDRTADASLPPSQLPIFKVLRRPIEFTQYLAIRYTEKLKDAGIEPSVGSVGDSYDNALAETINGLYKTEIIRPNGPWRNLEEVEFATLEWVDWFNHRRLLEPIGNIPPVEFETMYFQNQEPPAMEAGLT
jgi:transposase InsO family protein